MEKKELSFIFENKSSLISWHQYDSINEWEGKVC